MRRWGEDEDLLDALGGGQEEAGGSDRGGNDRASVNSGLSHHTSYLHQQ